MTMPTRWREVTRWSYKQPITLFLQRNEWCAINQRHYRRSIGDHANVQPIGWNVHNAHGTARRVPTHRVWAVDPSQRRSWRHGSRLNWRGCYRGQLLIRADAQVIAGTILGIASMFAHRRHW